MLRQPIVAVLGHVDHGKTTLLDKIRGTAVAAREAGLITQHAGASEIPASVIKETCGSLLQKLNIDLKVPGLLLLDTPGHAAFTAMRRRGGSIADLAILVIDITQGIQEQTTESIEILKQFKTPFIVAATKLDRVDGWIAHQNACFSESLAKQPEHVRENVDKMIYKLVGQLSEKGFESERFDRVEDFKRAVAIVPVSGITGEGIPELLVMLAGLAQTYLSDQLELKGGAGRGSILEVKELRGLGTIVDAILYDGEIKTGDWLIVGGREPVVTKIKAMLKPKPMRELRVEKEFESVSSVSAAAGVKIAAPELEKVVAGSPFAVVHTEEEIEKAKAELAEAIASIEFETAEEGVIVRADTLGSLEALLTLMKGKNIPVKRAAVGPVTRRDISEESTISDPLKRAVLVFNLPVDEDVARDAKDHSVQLMSNAVIYRLLEGFEAWLADEQKKLREARLASITRPARLKFLPGMTFHVRAPAIVGVEVIAGVLKSGVNIRRTDGKEVGIVKAIQAEGSTVDVAEKGARVAISIDEPQVGRHIFEGDEFEVIVTPSDLKVLEELGMTEEAALARELLSK